MGLEILLGAALEAGLGLIAEAGFGDERVFHGMGRESGFGYGKLV